MDYDVVEARYVRARVVQLRFRGGTCGEIDLAPALCSRRIWIGSSGIFRFPVRLHPFTSADVPSTAKPIAIDPAIAFGRPILTEHGISTAAIVKRIDAGDVRMTSPETTGCRRTTSRRRCCTSEQPELTFHGS
jgi:hypothetical protein